MGLGAMLKECPKCNGIGHIKEKNDEIDPSNKESKKAKALKNE
jgi:phage FluMu protein Com